MQANWIALGALGCALAVGMGAFGAHGLRSRLDAEALALWETGARYLMYGALAVLAIGIYGRQSAAAPIGAAAGSLAIGALIFALTLAALTCLALPAPAAGLEWAVVPEQSRVLFDYSRNDQPDTGHFARFTGGGVFDRDAPGEATLELRIESASIDLGEPIVSAFATSAEWFDSANYPLVVYRLLKLTPESGNDYHAAGTLTIRGRTRPIETTITLEIGDGEAHASGSLRMDRKDYRLGVGPSALFVKIGREVAVRFDLIARRAP